MATVSFTQNLRGATGNELQPMSVSAPTVAAALEQVFESVPRLRSYLLDDRGALRKHIAVFVDGQNIADRESLSDALTDAGEVFVAQALSGG